jgi:hypothetical protein
MSATAGIASIIAPPDETGGRFEDFVLSIPASAHTLDGFC